MTAQWTEMPIGEVLRLEYGKPLNAADRKPDGLYPVYGANGEKDRTDRFYFEKPSIIVGRKGSAGEVNLAEDRFWPLDVTYFATFDERRHDLRFLYYLLTTLDLPRLAKGVKPGINRNEVYSQVAAIPPLAEQRRIVGILDEAFDGIAMAKANAEKNLQSARALFESHLQFVVTRHGEGWVETSLGAEIDLLAGFAFKSPRYTDSEESVRLLRGDNIVQGALRWDDAKRWPASDVAEYERYQLRAGDVVLAMDRPWVSAGLKRARISEDDLPSLLVQRTARLRGNGRLDNRFLVYLISSAAFAHHILGVQTGLGVPHVSGQQIKDFRFQRPPLDEQLEIADQLDALADATLRLESIYQRKLAALDELKKSLLRQAFMGQLGSHAA
jgi:type I restriction enzyme, S subunit